MRSDKRVKTAQVIVRFLPEERDELERYVPPGELSPLIRSLLRQHLDEVRDNPQLALDFQEVAA